MPIAKIIDGRVLAHQIVKDLTQTIQNRKLTQAPGLATVLVGNDPASVTYVTNKRKQAGTVGIKSFHFDLSEKSSENDVINLIRGLNLNDDIHGILVQMPLPKGMNEHRVIDAIDAQKDVDGFHALNMGHLFRGDNQVVACTPLGVMHMLKSIDYPLRGKNAVVVGRSNIVGKPMAQLLLQADATVTLCHVFTQNLSEVTKNADVLVVAVGRAKLIGKDHVKPGAVVIDVGMNRNENNRLCGDVDYDAVSQIASYITPVPGGVGPLTIAMLLKNTWDNFLRIQNER